MIFINRLIIILIFSLIINSLVYANNGCVVNGFDINKTENDSITIDVKDNGNCFMYTFIKTGDELYSLISSNGMLVDIDAIDIDAYSRSKISSIIPRENVIYFRLNFDPSITYKLVDAVTSISFTPPKGLIIVDNNPINMIERIECKRSIGIIDIRTTSPISFDYGMVKDNLQFVDIDDVYISDKTEIIGSCKADLTYSYISYPLKVRFLISNLNYLNNIAYLLEDNLLTFSQIIEENIVYVTKISQEILDNKTIINIGLSSGDITAIVKKSDREFIIEINENTSSIGNLSYQRRFTTGAVRSIGRQSIGKKDRFVVRIDSGNNINIINKDNGFIIETFEDSEVNDNISIIDKKTKKAVTVKDSSLVRDNKTIDGVATTYNSLMIDNKTVESIQDRDNSSAVGKKAIIEQSGKDE